MAKKQPSDDVSTGKFDILATYTSAQALLDGMTDDEDLSNLKDDGMPHAVLGFYFQQQDRHRRGGCEEHSPQRSHRHE